MPSSPTLTYKTLTSVISASITLGSFLISANARVLPKLFCGYSDSPLPIANKIKRLTTIAEQIFNIVFLVIMIFSILILNP